MPDEMTDAEFFRLQNENAKAHKRQDNARRLMDVAWDLLDNVHIHLGDHYIERLDDLCEGLRKQIQRLRQIREAETEV